MYNYIQDINKSEADILWNKKKTASKRNVYYMCRAQVTFTLWLTPPPSSFERYCLWGSEVNLKKKDLCRSFCTIGSGLGVHSTHTETDLKTSCNFVMTLNLTRLLVIWSMNGFVKKMICLLFCRTYGTQSLSWFVWTQVLWLGSTLCGQPWDWSRGVQVFGPLQATL